MSFYAVSADTVVVVNPKAGSTSISEALNKVPNKQVSALEALSYPKRVMFLRHPIERVNSLFNMFYGLSLNNSQYSEFMPIGTITAYGSRVRKLKGLNEHSWKGEKKALYEAKLKEGLANGATDRDLELTFNNQDYRRFVDYVLSGKQDSHWESQVEQSTLNGALIPNTVHKLSDLNHVWKSYVGSPIPESNSWPSVEHENYRLEDLEEYYKSDLKLWSTL